MPPDYPTHFAKRYTLPPRITLSTYYYPLYGGYQSGSSLLLFLNSTHALTWSLTAWNGKNLPDFLRFVGVIQCAPSDVHPTPMPTSRRPSQVELQYFSSACFFFLEESCCLLKASIPYIKCYEEDFLLSILTLLPLQDYQMSSNSIYRTGCTCPTVHHDHFAYVHYNMLQHKLNSSKSGFIQLENKFLSQRWPQ